MISTKNDNKKDRSLNNIFKRGITSRNYQKSRDESNKLIFFTG